METPHRIDRRRFIELGFKSAAIASLPVNTFAADAKTTSQPAKADRWPIGCFTRPWREHDYRVAMDAIAVA